MKGICVLVCLFLAFAAAWESGENEFFRGKSQADIKKLMGWNKNPEVKLPLKVAVPTAVPTSFDSRTQWPHCSSIGTIQNQAECGSCWAFGAVEAITDRMCISKGNDTQLSFQDMVSCNSGDGGCEGGDAGSAWDYAKKHGLVSAECYPYSIPTCPPAQQPCLNFVDTPKCITSCNNTKIDYNADKRKISSTYSIDSRNSGIETEIMTHGPVEACFEVYEDFLSYKSGVYSHKTGNALGGHCVKILGWGVDNGAAYWIVANSWTATWGNQGYFWIARGSNECGIENDVVAGLP